MLFCSWCITLIKKSILCSFYLHVTSNPFWKVGGISSMNNYLLSEQEAPTGRREGCAGSGLRVPTVSSQQPLGFNVLGGWRYRWVPSFLEMPGSSRGCWRWAPHLLSTKLPHVLGIAHVAACSELQGPRAAPLGLVPGDLCLSHLHIYCVALRCGRH